MIRDEIRWAYSCLGTDTRRRRLLDALRLGALLETAWQNDDVTVRAAWRHVCDALGLSYAPCIYITKPSGTHLMMEAHLRLRLRSVRGFGIDAKLKSEMEAFLLLLRTTVPKWDNHRVVQHRRRGGVVTLPLGEIVVTRRDIEEFAQQQGRRPYGVIWYDVLMEKALAQAEPAVATSVRFQGGYDRWQALRVASAKAKGS